MKIHYVFKWNSCESLDENHVKRARTTKTVSTQTVSTQTDFIENNHNSIENIISSEQEKKEEEEEEEKKIENNFNILDYLKTLK